MPRLTAGNAVATILSGFLRVSMLRWLVFAIVAVVVRPSHARPSHPTTSTPTITSKPLPTSSPTNLMSPTGAFVSNNLFNNSPFPSSFTAAPTPIPTVSPTTTAAPTSALSPPSCTVCVHGNDLLHVNQSKAFSIPGLLAQTCGELLQTAELFSRDSAACGSIRTLGSYCGCPTFPKACTLCPGLSQYVIAENAQNEVPVEASQYNIFGAPPGTVLNCETLESALLYLAMSNATLCQQTQDNPHYGVSCCFRTDLSHYSTPTPAPLLNNKTCSVCLDGSNITFPNRLITLGAYAVHNCSDLVTLSHDFAPTKSECGDIQFLGPYCGCPPPPRTTCTVCLDGSDITLPNRTITLGALPVNNCSDLVTLTDRFAPTDSQCSIFQLLGPYCGCPVTPRVCSLCPNGETVPFPNRPFPLLESFQGLPPALLRRVGLFFDDLTCGEFQSILHIDPASTIGLDPGSVCLVGQFQSTKCGCSRGFHEVLVTWLFRVSAFLSIIGAFFIVRDVMKKPTGRRTTYHQVILGTTCFDVITSTAYLLSGLLLPRPAYEGHGTHGTCVFQGILIQLGLTSLFYSVLLSVYYLLTIKHNWTESRFRKYRKYFHLPIITTGVALTAAASTSIAPQLGFCYVAIPPQAASRKRITFLFVVPSSVALVTIFTCTLLTCYHVYSKEHTTLKWSAKRNLALTKKVCWQSFWYFIGFAVTIPCVMLNYYGDFRTNNHFGAFATAALFAPAQGFLNSLVYFHRASKGSQWKWRKLLGVCWRKGSLASELPQTADRPTTGRPVSIETFESSQDLKPPEETDTVPSNEESSEHNKPTNVPDSEVGATEIGRGSQESQSDEFSAAAAHWLMDTLDDQSDENSQPTRATPTTFLRRVFSGASMNTNRQSVVRTDTMETLESSQDHQPCEATDTGPSNEESIEHITHTNIAESEVGAGEVGRESQESSSDEFSAALAHWLTDTRDYSDENRQSARAIPTTF